MPSHTSIQEPYSKDYLESHVLEMNYPNHSSFIFKVMQKYSISANFSIFLTHISTMIALDKP